MRTFIKDYFFLSNGCGGSWRDNYSKSYHMIDWEFTGRILYQHDEDGKIQVSFEVNRNNCDQWINSDNFAFDKSSHETIICCTEGKKHIKPETFQPSGETSDKHNNKKE